MIDLINSNYVNIIIPTALILGGGIIATIKKQWLYFTFFYIVVNIASLCAFYFPEVNSLSGLKMYFPLVDGDYSLGSIVVMPIYLLGLLGIPFIIYCLIKYWKNPKFLIGLITFVLGSIIVLMPVSHFEQNYGYYPPSLIAFAYFTPMISEYIFNITYEYNLDDKRGIIRDRMKRLTQNTTSSQEEIEFRKKIDDRIENKIGDNVENNFVLGSIYFYEGNFEKSISYYSEAIKNVNLDSLSQRGKMVLTKCYSSKAEAEFFLKRFEESILNYELAAQYADGSYYQSTYLKHAKDIKIYGGRLLC